MVGGNHDRWDSQFWERDLHLIFQPRRATFEIGARKVLAIHGDGLTDSRWQAKLIHRVIQHRATAAIYRLLHPELGFRLVDFLSPALGDHTQDEATLNHAAEQQRTWAERLLQDQPSLGLVIMGHTHRPIVADMDDNRQYLNPGAWFDGFRYAVATEADAELCQFTA
jgi:UDP-2,3-diacylglucosamine hydrolase